MIHAPRDLTDQERDRFVEWLRHEIETSQELILEVKKLNLPTTHIVHQGEHIAVCLELINKLQVTGHS